MQQRIALLFSLSFLGIPALAAETLPSIPHHQNVTAHIKATVTTLRFSIDYPDHWIVTDNRNDYVIIYNQSPPQMGGGEAPPYMIKTDISVQQTSLREALSTYENEPDRVRRIEEVTINGRLGVRVWGESEGWAFPNSLITYIPVSDREVAYVISFYSPENQAAERAIIQMQNTFKVF
jgi:hypothetical protein